MSYGINIEPLSILQPMLELYQLPRSRARFEKYLDMLQGPNKDDMVMPIGYFNPMANKAGVEQLQQLIDHKAEELISKAWDDLSISHIHHEHPSTTIGVAINLVDDVEGAWSERHPTDYKSKFEFGAHLKRQFCTPIFFTSESLDEQLIIKRIQGYLCRTVYWLEHSAPLTLGKMVDQEIFVASFVRAYQEGLSDIEAEFVDRFFKDHAGTSSSDILFNFFYGDQASSQLNYKTFGLPEKAGFRYAALRSLQEIN